jgi:hypothetical protein
MDWNLQRRRKSVLKKCRNHDLKDRRDYLEKWKEVNNDGFETEKVKRLIFDTYHYFYGSRESGSVSRNDLPIYRQIIQFFLQNDEYSEDTEEYEFDCCIDFACGLCCAIETGFEAGYGNAALPLGLSYHIPGGCAAPEADLSSYDAYERAFQEEIRYFMEEHLDE